MSLNALQDVSISLLDTDFDATKLTLVLLLN